MKANKSYDFEAYKRVLIESQSIAQAREAAGWKPSTASKCRKGLPAEWLTFTDEVLGPAGMPKPAREQVKVISAPSSKPVVMPPEMIAQQGRFARLPDGEVPNPEGGSRLASVRAAIKHTLRSQGAEPIAANLYKVASGNTKHDSDAIRAAEAIRDTIGEKPGLNIDMRGLIVMMPAEAVMSNLDEWAGLDE